MPSAASDKQTTDLVVDAHVHIYPFMPVRAMLDAAGRNLFRLNGSAAAEGATKRDGVLLVADPDGVAGYERLLAEPGEGEGGSTWRRDHGDDRSVTFTRDDARVTAIRGQQLITSEGLEVLGIACDARLRSGFPLEDMVARIRAARGWAIVAWGAGKWLGRRGRLLTKLIEAEAGRPEVMLADNGGRPRAWSRVPQFEVAAKQGMRVLAGTDPLPLAGEEQRIGSYGFRIRVRADRTRPAESLWRALETDTPIEILGRPMPVRGFLANQLRLRLQRRSRRPSP
ncbi:MAG TPA: hypothetical protein VHG33_10610 [Woeseiaceae bacterium]|nr:hypothetical protein [Woeseiaceae bacterium]